MDIKPVVETYKAGPESQGMRIDLFLAEKSGRSRSFIQKMIEDGRIEVNSGKTSAKGKIHAGDFFRLIFPPPLSLGVLPENLALKIIYEDEFLAVIDKPRSMSVHPGAGCNSGTLVNALLYHLDDLSGIGGVERPGIVHRLDKDTSGIMLVAKNDFAHNFLSGQFSQRKIKKIYVALVHGNMSSSAGKIMLPIGRHPSDRKKMAVVQKGRQAHTEWEVIEKFRDFAFLKIRIFTGRTHQIRVHMAYLKHPVVGDPVYGNRPNPFGADAQLLHSFEITFTHPHTMSEMTFSADIPPDMEDAVNTLRRT